MSWYSLSPLSRLSQIVCVIMAVALLAVSCGGSDSEGAEVDDATSSDTEQPATPGEPTIGAAGQDETAADADEVVIPTSTPLPTATALPTATPLPLDEPTPSAVLLATAFTNSSKVTTVGIDEVFFGMTAEEAAEAASTTWVGAPEEGKLCYRVTPADGPDGVTLWVVDGHVERVDIEHPDLRTPSKLGIGNTLDELRGQLGDRLTVETAGSGGATATFTPVDPGDREFRIVFELEADQVVRYRSGRLGVIDRAPEGC